MLQGEDQAFRSLVSEYQRIHFYAADPGAFDMLSEIKCIVQELNIPGRWALEGWALLNSSIPELELSPVEELIKTAEFGTCLFLGPQINFRRTRQILSLCQNVSIETVFVFDAWKNYKQHFVSPSENEIILPTKIVVPDEFAYQGVKKALSGTKNMENILILACHFAMMAACKRILARSGEWIGQQKRLLQVGDKRVIGVLLDPPQEQGMPYLGYDYVSTLKYITNFAQNNEIRDRIIVKPHPRHSFQELKNDEHIWKKEGVDIEIHNIPPEDLLAISDEVWGMTTIALVTALNLGKLVRSFQVGRTEIARDMSNPHIEPFVVA